MKATLISKLILIFCILSLVVGFINLDSDKLYNEKEKTTARMTAPANKIAVLNLEGAIVSSYENKFFSREANAANLLKSLYIAAEDDDIKGVIINIKSPGGTVAMSQNIYNQIMKIRKKKPVIAVLDDVCASGGYYIASATDRIIAQDGSLTGSIGVIFSYMDVHSLLQKKLSVNPIVVKSGKYKDMGSPVREVTPEELALFQSIVDDSYEQFVTAITKGRVDRIDKYNAIKTDLTIENLRANADGRVFTGKKAKELGFVDELGDIDTAKSMIQTMAQEKFNNKLKVKLVDYNKKSSFSDYFSSLTEYSASSSIRLNDIVPTSMILNRKPLYLWE